ncbi:MAG: hypothetical protein ACOVRB_06075 [Akkermansiaceae bacterium]
MAHAPKSAGAGSSSETASARDGESSNGSVARLSWAKVSFRASSPASGVRKTNQAVRQRPAKANRLTIQRVLGHFSNDAFIELGFAGDDDGCDRTKNDKDEFELPITLIHLLRFGEQIVKHPLKNHKSIVYYHRNILKLFDFMRHSITNGAEFFLKREFSAPEHLES